MSSEMMCSFGVSFQSERANKVIDGSLMNPLGTVSGVCSRILKGSSCGNITSKNGRVYGIRAWVFDGSGYDCC